MCRSRARLVTETREARPCERDELPRAYAELAVVLANTAVGSAGDDAQGSVNMG